MLKHSSSKTRSGSNGNLSSTFPLASESAVTWAPRGLLTFQVQAVFFRLYPAWMLHSLHRGTSHHKIFTPWNISYSVKITSILISQLKISVHPVSFIKWTSQLFCFIYEAFSHAFPNDRWFCLLSSLGYLAPQSHYSAKAKSYSSVFIILKMNKKYMKCNFKCFL